LTPLSHNPQKSIRSSKSLLRPLSTYLAGRKAFSSGSYYKTSQRTIQAPTTANQKYENNLDLAFYVSKLSIGRETGNGRRVSSIAILALTNAAASGITVL